MESKGWVADDFIRWVGDFPPESETPLEDEDDEDVRFI